MNKILSFIKESIEELRLVRWPTRKQAVRFSGVVIVFVAICAVIFGVIDFGLSELIRLLLSLV